MVFPEPAGHPDRARDPRGRSPPRRAGSGSSSTAPLIRRTGNEAAVLAYRAEAARPDGAPHRALCSSSYVQQAGDWWLVQHQQTPV